MLKIMEIHLSAHPAGEYIVLQNHGLSTVNLLGWAVCSDAYLHNEPIIAAAEMYVFQEEAAIKPYGRIVLFTGVGHTGWYPTNDGKQAYVAYWGRERCMWREAFNIHVLQVICSRRVILPDAEQEYMASHTA